MSEALPESPLSSLSSSDELVDDHVSTPNRSARPSIDTETTGPPSKRRKTGGGSTHGGMPTPGGGTIMTATATTTTTTTASTAEHGEDTEADISCDSEGSAPGSPSQDEYALRADQVTTCAWEGCSVGNLANSDELITHVQNDHIAPKRARYTCEWGDCARKGTNHPSGYALKAHMRSHTKEKPFFCHLPECDRSFTRSDALAKHMRTVHEPEPPRASATNANPLDPATGLPKKGPKLRLSINGKAAAARAASEAAATAAAAIPPQNPDDPSPPMDNIQYIPARHPITGQPGFMITYPPDIHFTQFESEIPANQLMRLLRRQLHWATKEAEELKAENDQLEIIRKQEWAAKEALLDGVLEGTLASSGLQDGSLEEMQADVWEPESDDVEWSHYHVPWWKRKDQAEQTVEADTDMEGVQDQHTASASQAERDDDMMAVGALMGLSAG